MIIYKVTNLKNGKSYIGQTIQNFERYKKNHINNALKYKDIKKNETRPFYRALRLYGADTFTWEILCECSSRKELNEKEKYFISFYKTFSVNGYNLTEGGCGTQGSHLPKSDETKRKISQTIRSKLDERSGKNHPLYGIGHKKESIVKMSESKKGMKNPRAQRFLFISPTKEEFIVEGRFNQFCAEHNLGHNAMTEVHRGNRDNVKGWRCFNMKDNSDSKPWKK